jgi:hypothetical protein
MTGNPEGQAVFICDLGIFHFGVSKAVVGTHSS